jgi:hypothetical protein
VEALKIRKRYVREAMTQSEIMEKAARALRRIQDEIQAQYLISLLCPYKAMNIKRLGWLDHFDQNVYPYNPPKFCLNFELRNLHQKSEKTASPSNESPYLLLPIKHEFTIRLDMDQPVTVADDDNFPFDCRSDASDSKL